MWCHIRDTLRGVKFIETDGRVVVAGDCGEGRLGHFSLMGREFLFVRGKEFWRRLHNSLMHLILLNRTLENCYYYKFCYVHFNTHPLMCMATWGLCAAFPLSSLFCACAHALFGAFFQKINHGSKAKASFPSCVHHHTEK